MAAHRYFYVTQEDLVVWLQHRGRFAEVARFASNDEGFAGFSRYLGRKLPQKSLMLVDVIEEEFAADSIPKLPMRDRNALIERRLSRKYSRTPYRLGHSQGAAAGKAREQQVLYSAISNHELLDPWLEIIADQQIPLVGVFSVPLLGFRLLSRMRKPTGNALLLTQHQGNRLRQIFLRDGKLKSARLSLSPAINDAAYGDYIFDEILRNRRYLERSRLLGGMEEIDAYMITDPATADRIIAGDKGRMPLRFHFIKPESAAKTIRLPQVPETDHLEVLFLAIANSGRAGENYALQGETRYHRLSTLRRMTIGTALAAAMACSVVAGVNLTTGLQIRNEIAVVDRQILQMEETFRRENDRFAPLRADSHEMKLAVDTGNFILDNRLPVGWVMQQLGQVLGDYPQIQIEKLEWRAEAPASGQQNNQARRGGPPPAVPIKRLHAVSAELSGQIVPFDGDLRAAFATIDKLARELQAQTAFDQVVTTEFPINAGPTASISGEVVSSGATQSAFFRMRLSLVVSPAESASETS